MSKNSSKIADIAIAVTLVAAVTGSSFVDAAEQIRWRTGAVATTPKTPGEIADAVTAIATDPDARHLVVQFDAPVGAADRANAAAAGLKLLRCVGDNAFFASIAPSGIDRSALGRIGSLIDATPIERTWKLHPFLAAGKVPTWAVVSAAADKDTSGPVVVGAYVLFHPDVPLATHGVSIARRHGAVVRSHLETINGLVIELPFDNIEALADEDAVQWVEPPLPRMVELNNSNREITGANIVQAPPYNLDGTGVTVLVYDGGYGRSSHVDFGGRHTVRDSSGLSDHATHVACTVGGSGAASGGNYRGMAPGVTIESYGFDYDGSGIFLYSNPGDIEDDYDEAINVYGAHISNNSIGTNTCWNGFPCEITGNYGITSVLIDSIIGGSLGGPIRIVWANGNERSCTGCPGEHQNGYHSTAPPACAKNHITVGALNSNNDSQTEFTSWGPADDGRMKPDIAAPGCQSNDDYDVTSCSSSGDTSYTGKCGTSMAAPTVTGLSALLLQDFRAQFPGEPDFRNSTLKVLLAHNAVDLSPTGPDYKAGYGSVRIQPTVDFMRTGNFLEAEVSQGEAYSVLVVVNPGEELKITLAWDDVPGTPNVDPALVNDLDLVVYAPGGARHYPWTLDPDNPSAAAVQTQADHLNNIEQVHVASAASGAWQVEIHGFNVPQGPQPFSLAASPYLVNCSTVGINSLDRVKYSCEGVALLQVIDCDLNTDDGVVETVTVTIESDSESAGETVLLTETAAESAAFRGMIPLSVTDAEGVLQVAHDDTVTTTYIDADDGYGGINVVVEADAVVDCIGPVISNVQAVDVEPRNATITFDVDEPASANVYYGFSCGSLTESASAPGYKTAHTVPLTGLEDDRTYFYAVAVQDEAGNPSSDDNGGNCYLFTTPDIPDFFTEEFGSDNDLDFLTFEFNPDGSFDYYAACVEPDITELPTDPSGGTSLSFSPSNDDGYAAVSLSGGQTVSLYGTDYGTFYVGSNGYITFGTGDSDYTEELSDHFSLPRISALFDDLNPSQGGTVSWKQTSDRAAVTWDGVPEYSEGNTNTFQIEMLFDGTIRCTYLTIDAEDGIVGVSAGDGLSPDFYETDLSDKGPCALPGDCDDDGDIDEDDFAVFVDCFTGPGGAAGPQCACVSLDADEDVDCKDWNLFQLLWTAPDDPPAFGPCAQPIVSAIGGRYLAVTPAAGSTPIAILVTGDAVDPGISCISMYVQTDGSLGAAPVFRPPTGPDGWNTVHVFGEEIMPDTNYGIRGDFGSPGNPLLSPARYVTTRLWGDVEYNHVVNFTDVQWIVLWFEGTSSPAPFEATNIAPCEIDDAVNFTDIQAAIFSFEGTEYRGTVCTPPCP